MSVQAGESAEEIKRLQRCINDLISVLALPAMWSGAEPSKILHTLLEALLRMLQLDMVYVRLKETDGRPAVEMVRYARWQNQVAAAQEIGGFLKQRLGADAQDWPAQMRSRWGDRDLSIVPLGLGLQGEVGVLVAAAERAEFPLQTERLLLSVAANQASIGLQEARLLSEQKRIASELDRRVALRTAELATANEELRREIGERREMEKRLLASETLLKESEARLWEMINTIPVVAWFSLPDGTNQFHNKRWSEYTGISREESTGSGWRAAYHPEDLPRLVKRRQEYMSAGEPGEIQARVRRFDGEYRWFLIRAEPFRDESGEIVRWYGTCTDIHDRKLAQDELQRSEEKYRVVVETASDAIISMDEGGVIIFANAAAKSILGYEPAELMGKPLTMLMPAMMRQLHRNGFSRYVATGHRNINWRGTELTALRKNGQEFPVEISFGEMTRDGHKAFTGLIRDITEKKRIEETLRNTQAQLSRATRTATVGEFAASIAHEINQPLAAVVANGHACLRWLSSGPEGLAKAQEAAERIVRDGKEAGEIMRRIRVLFKKASIEKAELDLNEVIAEVVHLLGGETAKRRVAIEAELADDLPPVVGDRVQLQQVAFNLLLNGIEAMEPALGRPRKLFIRSKRENPETILVEIQDNGVGMENAEKVFEAFFTTKEQGMGMGLTICRSIIDAHHGRLWAASSEGEGTTFSFTLPVQPSGKS